MYVCRMRVLHISLKGKNYVRWHIIKVHTTLKLAVTSIGALPPTNKSECLTIHASRYPEIEYGKDAIATTKDPAYIIIHLIGLQGGVFVDVPYKCTFDELVQNIVPKKLQSIGVHKHDVKGTLCNLNNTYATEKNVWNCSKVQHFLWTKLKATVKHTWPKKVLSGIVKLQQIHRDKQSDWVVLNNKDSV